MKAEALSPDLLHRMDAYWRAANYPPAGQIDLLDNLLLRERLTVAHMNTHGQALHEIRDWKWGAPAHGQH